MVRRVTISFTLPRFLVFLQASSKHQSLPNPLPTSQPRHHPSLVPKIRHNVAQSSPLLHRQPLMLHPLQPSLAHLQLPPTRAPPRAQCPRQRPRPRPRPHRRRQRSLAARFLHAPPAPAAARVSDHAALRLSRRLHLSQPSRRDRLVLALCEP